MATQKEINQIEIRQLRALVERSMDGVGMADLNGIITYANAAYCQMVQDPDLVGTSILETYAEPQEKMFGLVGQVMREGHWQGVLNYRRRDGTTFPGWLSAFNITDDEGNVIGVAGFFRDITEKLQADQERETLQQQVIEAQREAIRELSTPLIPLSRGVVLMPLIGTIDTTRAQMVIEMLLDGVTRYQSNVAILDITGVQVVDTQVANVLIRAAQAVRLIGAKTILTGISPQIAQTLVGLGINLEGIEARRTLEAAIEETIVR